IASPAHYTTTGTSGSGANVVTASLSAIKGAVAYDWYVGTSAAWFYYTTTTVASVTITSVPTAAQALPTTLPLLSTLLPGVGCAPLAQPPTAGNGQAPTADTSYNANYYNGIIASTLGDYSSTGPVTPGG